MTRPVVDVSAPPGLAQSSTVVGLIVCTSMDYNLDGRVSTQSVAEQYTLGDRMSAVQVERNDSYKTLAKPHSTSITVERSKFIAHGAIVMDAEEARAYIASVQQDYRDATHNCWAYRAGTPGPETEYCSDAGEPSGSAGRPILSVIRSSDLHNCAIVVTRYFGGRKLGIPGLIKAYSRAAQQLVDETGVKDRVVMRRLNAVCEYARLNQVDHVLRSLDAVVEDRIFTDKVKLTACIGASQCDLLVDSLSNLCEEVALEDDRPHLVSD